MAVDANVLVFERIREELKKAKSARKAIELGYERAFSAIIDANITTLIAAVILLVFGSGPVKGVRDYAGDWYYYVCVYSHLGDTFVDFDLVRTQAPQNNRSIGAIQCV